MKRLGVVPDGSPLLDKVISEAWAGAHPSAPSTVQAQEGNAAATLPELLKQSAIEILGKRVTRDFNGELPFLFKLLSIGAPLSIQVHPDLQRARELHRLSPERFPESNHKPELGIACEPCTVLFGFRTPQEIESTFRFYPGLAQFLPKDPKLSEGEFLRELFMTLLQDPRVQGVADLLASLFAAKPLRSAEEELVLKLHALYPGDPGVLQVFVLNLLTLEPGEALAVPPNLPHAYLDGDLVECMAVSDFVIRAGLTPKPKDIPALIQTVEYRSTVPSPCPLIEQPGSQFRRYATNFSEFQVERSKGTVAESSDTDGPALYFAMSGSGELNTGSERTPFAAPDLVLVAPGPQPHEIAFAGELYRVTVPK